MVAAPRENTLFNFSTQLICTSAAASLVIAAEIHRFQPLVPQSAALASSRVPLQQLYDLRLHHIYLQQHRLLLLRQLLQLHLLRLRHPLQLHVLRLQHAL